MALPVKESVTIYRCARSGKRLGKDCYVSEQMTLKRYSEFSCKMLSFSNIRFLMLGASIKIYSL
jgi:hypothetical protein